MSNLNLFFKALTVIEPGWSKKDLFSSNNSHIKQLEYILNAPVYSNWISNLTHNDLVLTDDQKHILEQITGPYGLTIYKVLRIKRDASHGDGG